MRGYSLVMEKLTNAQRYALADMDVRGHLNVGWGGVTRRTLRSLEDRGLARTSLTNPDRYTLTEKGQIEADARWEQANG